MKETKMTPKESKKLAIRLQKKQFKTTAKSLAEIMSKDEKSKRNDDKKASKDNSKGKNGQKKPFNRKKMSSGSSLDTSKQSASKRDKFPSRDFKSRDNNFQPNNKSTDGGEKKSYNDKKPITGVKRKADEISDDQGNSSQKKKELKKRRKSLKSNFTLVEDVKGTWNKLRVKAMALKDKQVLIESMISKISGSVVSVSLRHDASRIVQSIFQFGTVEQRRRVLKEMSPQISELAKTPYGHFTGLKAIDSCTEEDEQKLIIQGLKGHFVSLGTNVIGARTVELILQTFPITLTRLLKAEFYGHKFILLLPEAPRNLHSIVETLPNKLSPLLDHMKDLVQRFVDKGLLSFAYVHQLLWEYIRELTSSKGMKGKFLEDLVSSLVESVLHLATTKPGAKSCCIIATYGNAKERKRMIKTMKGNVMSLAMHHSSHLPLMRLIDVTDDTVNIQKSLLDEIRSVKPVVKYSADGTIVGKPLPALISLALDPFGSKFLLRLINPKQRHLEPDEEVLFISDPSITSSKKFAEMRWKENLTYLQVPLIQVCNKYANDLLRNRYGCKVLEAVMQVFYPNQLLQSLAMLFIGMTVHTGELSDDKAMIADDANDEDSDEEDNEVIEEDEAQNEAGNMIDYWSNENDDTVNKSSEKMDEDDENADDHETEDPMAEALPLQEDPVSHSFMKSLVQFESKLFQEGKDEVDSLNMSFWNGKPVFTGSYCMSILNHLNDDEQRNTLDDWLSHNRPCLALADIFKINSEAKSKVMELLSKCESKLIESKGNCKGASILHELYASAKPKANATTEKKKGKAKK